MADTIEPQADWHIETPPAALVVATNTKPLSELLETVPIAEHNNYTNLKQRGISPRSKCWSIGTYRAIITALDKQITK